MFKCVSKINVNTIKVGKKYKYHGRLSISQNIFNFNINTVLGNNDIITVNHLNFNKSKTMFMLMNLVKNHKTFRSAEFLFLFSRERILR